MNYPYIINVGMSKDNLQPYAAAKTLTNAISIAKSGLSFYRYTEAVYMPEDDVDLNEVKWRSWEDN